jgi:hypothetical protein
MKENKFWEELLDWAILNEENRQKAIIEISDFINRLTMSAAAQKPLNINIDTYLLPGKQKVQISDWLHPSINDLFILQNYLNQAPRPELAFTNLPATTWREERLRNFKMIVKERPPEFKILPMNREPTNKQNCIVTYVSYNENYEKKLLNLISELEKSGFKGHIIYRIWRVARRRRRLFGPF